MFDRGMIHDAVIAHTVDHYFFILIMNYKEIHGGTFRRVELSGLLDSVEKLKKKEKEKTEKVKKSIPIR
jgi:hypothetical protein